MAPVLPYLFLPVTLIVTMTILWCTWEGVMLSVFNTKVLSWAKVMGLVSVQSEA